MPAYKRILVPVDGSETSNKALAAAVELARDAGGGVRVRHPLEQGAHVASYEYVGQGLSHAREAAVKLLEHAVQSVRTAGVEADAQLVDERGTRLGDAVAQAAREWRADLIVVGT